MKSKYYLAWCFIDKMDTHKHDTYIQTDFSLTQMEGVVWPGETLPMLLPESSSVCVYIYTHTPNFRSVIPRVCLAKVPFLAFFGLI